MGAKPPDAAGTWWAGLPGWEDDPELSAAHVVIAERTAALTELLRRDARFEVAYEDGVAVLFVRRFESLSSSRLVCDCVHVWHEWRFA